MAVTTIELSVFIQDKEEPIVIKNKESIEIPSGNYTVGELESISAKARRYNELYDEI